MYIACPKCDTNFIVSTEQIGTYGRKVRCSRCGTIWHQKPKDHIRLEPTISEPLVTNNKHIKFAAGVNLPALLPIKIPVYLYGLPILLTILIIALSIILFQNTLGIKSNDIMHAFSIKDVHVDNLQDLNKMTVSYKIVNSSNNDLLIPLIRVRLFDKHNMMLKSHIAVHTKTILAPKQYVVIKTEFVSPPETTEKVDIMLGNMLDFILR